MASQLEREKWVPWDRPAEIILWAVALIIATFFIHNFTRIGKKHI